MIRKISFFVLMSLVLAGINQKALSAVIDFGDDVFTTPVAVSGFFVPWTEEGFVVYDLNSPAFTTAATIVKGGFPGAEPRLKISPSDATFRVEQLGPPLGNDALGPFDLISLDVEAAIFGDGVFEVVSSKGGIQDITTVMTHSFSGPLFDGITYFDIVLRGVTGISPNLASIFLDNIVVNPVSDSPPNPVPVPAAIWLFGAALIGLMKFSK